MAHRGRLRNKASQECDPLDDLGYALQAEKEEPDRDEQPDRPAQQPTSVARNLVPVEGLHEHRPRQIHDDERHRQQEEETAEEVYPALRSPRQPPSDDVDADMLVAPQRVAGAQQEDGGEEIPLGLEPGIRADIEGVAQESVEGADQHRDQDQPIDVAAYQIVQPIDRPAQSQQNLQDLPLPLNSWRARPPALSTARYSILADVSSH